MIEITTQFRQVFCPIMYTALYLLHVIFDVLKLSSKLESLLSFKYSAEKYWIKKNTNHSYCALKPRHLNSLKVSQNAKFGLQLFSLERQKKIKIPSSEILTIISLLFWSKQFLHKLFRFLLTFKDFGYLNNKILTYIITSKNWTPRRHFFRCFLFLN